MGALKNLLCATLRENENIAGLDVEEGIVDSGEV